MIRTIRVCAGVVVALAVCACSRSEPPVSFSQDVGPVLERRCAYCHTPGQPGYDVSQLSFASYEDLMKGTRFGPVIVPGDSFGSTLVILIEGRADPSIAMPHGDNDPLLKGEIDTIKAWIDQGAPDN